MHDSSSGMYLQSRAAACVVAGPRARARVTLARRSAVMSGAFSTDAAAAESAEDERGVY